MKQFFTTLLPLLITTCMAAQPARLQLIHNAADPTLAIADIWVNDTLWLDNFAFKTATPYVDIPANAQLVLTLRPSNNFNIILASQYITPASGEHYVLLLNGVAGFGFANNPDPDAASITADFYMYTGAKEASASQNTVEFLIAHGSTDCQKTDFNLQGLATVADNLSYGYFDNGYTSVPAANYMLDVTPAASANPMATYNVNLTSWAGKAAVVFTSGFYNPQNNNMGPIFQLCYAMADGTTNCFNFLSGTEENNLVNEIGLYPNPASENVYIDLGTTHTGGYTMQLIDITGKVLTQQKLQTGISQISTANYKAGLYFIRIIGGSGQLVESKKLLVINGQ